jgi:hypothetical protein
MGRNEKEKEKYFLLPTQEMRVKTQMVAPKSSI